MKKMTGWVALVAGFAFAVGLTAGEDEKKNRDNKSTAESKKDRPVSKSDISDADFVRQAVSGGVFEVESSRYAIEGQAKSDAVKKFAEKMTKDHGKANQELVNLAARKNLPIPKGMLPAHVDQLKKLAGLNGAAFDAAYAKAQVDSHKEAVALFERGAKQLDDAELKAWAEKTLPTLREHQKHASNLARDAKHDHDDDDKGAATKGAERKKDRDEKRTKDADRKDRDAKRAKDADRKDNDRKDNDRKDNKD